MLHVANSHHAPGSPDLSRLHLQDTQKNIDEVQDKRTDKPPIASNRSQQHIITDSTNESRALSESKWRLAHRPQTYDNDLVTETYSEQCSTQPPHCSRSNCRRRNLPPAWKEHGGGKKHGGTDQERNLAMETRKADVPLNRIDDREGKREREEVRPSSHLNLEMRQRTQRKSSIRCGSPPHRRAQRH